MGDDMSDKPRRLADDAGYVHVGGQVFAPGDEVPAELQGEIRNEAVWADNAPAEAAAPVQADEADKPKSAPSRSTNRK